MRISGYAIIGYTNIVCLRLGVVDLRRRPNTGGMAFLAGSEPAARTALLVTAIAFALSEVTIRLRRTGNRDSVRVDRGSIIAVIGTIAAGVLAATWWVNVGLGAVRSAGASLVGGGIVLMWIGIALRQWAVWMLGPFFTVVVRVRDQQPVIDRGPFRCVRHPSYLGLLLAMVGLGLALQNWLSLLSLTILPIVGLAIRIRVEERALLAALGEPYRAYATAHRWRLIPGIW